MSDEVQGITVSIKPTAGYDAALLVFKGTASSVQAQVREFFGLRRPLAGDHDNTTDDELAQATFDGETPFETFVQGDALAKAIYASAGIGAKPVAKSYGKPANQQRAIAAKAEAKQDEPAHEFQPVLDELALATSQSEIGRIYAKAKTSSEAGYKGAFENADVLSAAKARSESFTKAAS